MSTKKFALNKSPKGATNQAGNMAVQPSTLVTEEDEEGGAETQKKQKWTREIPLDHIQANPFQARQIFDQAKLEELAEGMREHGFVGGGLPVRPHPTEPKMYQLVFGERRWRAARLANLTAISCEVSAYSDADMMEIGLLENIQREDLTNLEEGQMFQRLLALTEEDGTSKYSIRTLAKRIGKDKSYIQDRLQYVKAPEDVQHLATVQPDVSPRLVRELVKIETPEERAPVIEQVQAGTLRIEDVRAIVKEKEQAKEVATAKRAQPSTPVSNVSPQETVVSSLMAPVHEEVQVPLTPPPVQQDDAVIMKRLAQVRTVLTQFQSYKRMVSTDRPTEAERGVIGEIGGLVELLLERD